MLGVRVGPVHRALIRLGLSTLVMGGGWAVAPVRVLARQDTPPPAPAWTLERVISSALRKHPLVEAAKGRLDAERGDRTSAGALPNPVATLWSENAGFPGQSPLTLSPETSAYITVPVEPFIQRGSRIRHADLALGAAEASVTLAERIVARDAATAFFRVALAQAHLEAAQENDRGLERLTAYNRARVGEGVTPELDLLRLELERDRSATDVALADAALASARAALLPFLEAAEAGPLPLSTLHVAVDDAASAAAPAAPATTNLAALLARARIRRPELIAGRERANAAAAAIDIERSLVVRQLGATVGLKRTEHQTSMIAGISITVPLFDRNQGGVARATGERLTAERELAWVDRTVAAEVTGATAALEPLTRQLNALRPSYLTRAAEVQRLTIAAYEEGGATLLQALDASRALADARLTWSRTFVAVREAQFNLALATGSSATEALASLTGPVDPVSMGGVPGGVQ